MRTTIIISSIIFFFLFWANCSVKTDKTEIIQKTKIAFVSDRDSHLGEHDIYVMDDDGSNVTRITYNQAKCPTFSPDGKQIACVPIAGNNINGIFIVDLQSLHIKAIYNGFALRPRWSPDGNWIAYEGPKVDSSSAIWLIHPDGTGNKPVIVSSTKNASVGAPSWSPDSKNIAFMYDYPRFYDIYTVSIDNPTKFKQITDTPDISEFWPVWSPDGQEIVSCDKIENIKGKLVINIRTINGGKVKMVSNSLSTQFIDWSPDGKKIVFTNNRNGEIYTINRDGTGLKQLTDKGSNIFVAWSRV